MLNMLVFEFPVVNELLTNNCKLNDLPLGETELVLMANSPEHGRSDDIELEKLGGHGFDFDETMVLLNPD
jgi:hypothetical protein